MPHPLLEAFARPTWLELRAPAEARRLGTRAVPLVSGEGRTVVIAPGFLGSDRSMEPLGRWLTEGGYRVRIADLESNLRGSSWSVDRIIGALEESAEPAILIGHSRGGQQARVATQRRPELVAGLITLGAPFRSHIPRHFALRAVVESMRLANRLGWYFPDDGDDADYAALLAAPYEAGVAFTSIWSRSDGLVAWQSCADPAAVGVEVDCSHRGLVASTVAFSAIASAIAQLGREAPSAGPDPTD